LYWKLRSTNHYDFKTNIYTVPDLNVHFLGIHITPNTKGEIFLGPTAFPAFGKENYSGLKGLEPFATTKFIQDLGKQCILNKNGFRRYAKEEALKGLNLYF